jgi:hypothetical protein
MRCASSYIRPPLILSHCKRSLCFQGYVAYTHLHLRQVRGSTTACFEVSTTAQLILVRRSFSRIVTAFDYLQRRWPDQYAASHATSRSRVRFLRQFGTPTLDIAQADRCSSLSDKIVHFRSLIDRAILMNSLLRGMLPFLALPNIYLRS